MVVIFFVFSPVDSKNPSASKNKIMMNSPWELATMAAWEHSLLCNSMEVEKY